MLAPIVTVPAAVALVDAWIVLIRESPVASLKALISLLIDRRILRRTRGDLTGDSPEVDDVLAEVEGEIL
jgi:hypothetical protein